MHAPHLPHRKENKELKELFGRLRMVILSVVLAVFAGLTGALVVLGWVWPYAGEGDTWVLSQARSSLSLKQLEEIVKQEMASRIVGVYEDSSFLYGTEYLKIEDKLADATMIGSDGWLVMYYPKTFMSYKKWKVVLGGGLVYEIEKAVKDEYSDLLYIRLKSLEEKEKQFKIVSFGDKGIKPGDEIYVFESGNWNASYVKFSVLPKVIEPHLDTAPILTYSLSNQFKPGSVVINRSGRILGIINNDFNLLSYDIITRTMPFVLSESKIEYPSLQINGWFSEEMPIVSEEGLLSAFMITKVMNNKGLLRAGDVVTSIDGQEVNLNTYYQSISSKDTVVVNILRRGKNLEFEVAVGVVN